MELAFGRHAPRTCTERCRQRPKIARRSIELLLTVISSDPLSSMLVKSLMTCCSSTLPSETTEYSPRRCRLLATTRDGCRNRHAWGLPPSSSSRCCCVSRVASRNKLRMRSACREQINYVLTFMVCNV
eukprot:COSAG06_NODE_2478_length_6797_cov_23.033000_4_plen_128_part_00